MTDKQPPSISELLAHRPFVERLALQLTGERSSAEDLVQETWLAAIKRPPSHGGNLPAWLQQVLRNLHYRRKQREALWKTTGVDSSQIDEAPPADEVAEKSEILQLVTGLVLRMEEPYGSVLRLHLYDGLTPTQIATRLGRSINTITSQLARGRERLRNELDRHCDGERSRWIQALLPFVPSPARREPDAPPRGSRVARSSSRRLALAAGALLVTGLAAVVLTIAVREPRPSGEALGRTTSAAGQLAERPAIDGAPHQGSREATALVQEPAAHSTDAAPPAEDPWLDLEVKDPAGAPVVGASIAVTRPGDIQDGEDLATMESNETMTTWTEMARTDAEGRARIVPGGENSLSFTGREGDFWWGLVVRKPGFVSSLPFYLNYPLHRREPLRITLDRPSVTVRGRVLDPEGSPVHALVYIGAEEGAWVEHAGGYQAQRPMAVVTDARGSFTYDGLPAGEHRVVIRSDGFVPCRTMVDATLGITERDFVLDRGASAFGQVVTTDGQPVPGARIRARYNIARVRPVELLVTAAEDGTFRLTGFAPGLIPVFAEHPEDASLCASEFLTFNAHEEKEWLPVLDRHPPLRMRIVTDEDEPVPGAGVRLHNERARNWHKNYSADDDGVVTIPGLPLANYLADVYRSIEEIPQGVPSLVQGRKVAGEQDNVLVVPRERLEFGGVNGRLLLAPGVRLTNPTVYLLPRGESASRATGVDPETGIFSQRQVSPQSYALMLFVERFGVVPLGTIEVRPGETSDIGDRALPEASTIEVDWRWTGEDSQYHYDLKQVQAFEDGTEPWRWPVRVGEGRLTGPLQVFPGRFEWSVSMQGQLVDSRELVVEPGSRFSLITGADDTAPRK